MMELIQIQKAKLERNRLIIDDNVTLEEWKEIGQVLKQVEGSVQFWIGDWARFGEKQGFTGKYVAPAVYDELEEVTGYSRSTIQKFKYVADSTAEIREEESLLRSKDVSFGQYENVASLPPEQQKEFLQKASEENLTTRELQEKAATIYNKLCELYDDFGNFYPVDYELDGMIGQIEEFESYCAILRLLSKTEQIAEPEELAEMLEFITAVHEHRAEEMKNFENKLKSPKVTVMFEKHLFYQNKETQKIGYWNDDTGILSLEELIEQIPLLLDEGYRVKIKSNAIIETETNIEYFKRISGYDTSFFGEELQTAKARVIGLNHLSTTLKNSK